MSVTVRQLMSWDAHALSGISKTLLAKVDHVNGLVGEFTNATDIGAAWSGAAGDGAMKAAGTTAEKIGGVVMTMHAQAQAFSHAANNLDGLQQELRTIVLTLTIQYPGFTLGQDGTINPPTVPVPTADQLAKVAMLQAAAKALLVDAKNIDSGLSNALSTIKGSAHHDWVAIEARLIRSDSIPETSNVKAAVKEAVEFFNGLYSSDDVHKALTGSKGNKLYDSLMKLNANELNQFVSDLPTETADWWKRSTNAGPVGWKGWRPSAWQLKAADKILKTADRATANLLASVLGFNPRTAVPGGKGTDNVDYLTLTTSRAFKNGKIDVTEDINQGGDGDCAFMASMAAIARKYPEVVKRGIKQNANGTYTVTLYQNGHPIPVTIAASLPGHQIYDGTSAFSPEFSATPGSVWAPLYEKAYAVLYGGYGNMQGLGGPEAIQAVMGVKADDRPLKDVSFDDMVKQFNSGHVIVLGSAYVSANAVYVDAGHNIVAGHGYAVVSIDESAKTVLVQNPWGHYQDQAPQYVMLTESQMRSWFQGFTQGEPPK